MTAKTKEAEKPKLQSLCAYHDHIPATYICDGCGKSICYYCQRNSQLPYQCPECMPGYWKKKVKRERILCLVPLTIVIAIIVIGTAWLAYFYDPYYEDPYSDIYVYEEDIIPIIHEETFNQHGNNAVDITFKIYVTNWGTKDSGEVFIELFVMRNGTVRDEASSTKQKVKEDETVIFEIDTTIILGDWDIQLKIWEGKKVVQDGYKSIRVARDDIEDLTQFDFDQGGVSAKEDKESGDMMAEGSSIVAFLIVGLAFLIVVGMLIYKSRTTMPSMQAPMIPPPVGSPTCPHCRLPVAPGTHVCPSCKGQI